MSRYTKCINLTDVDEAAFEDAREAVESKLGESVRDGRVIREACAAYAGIDADLLEDVGGAEA